MKILIPLDGSKFAEAVLEAVLWLADIKDGEVHLVGVVDVEKFPAASLRLPHSRQDIPPLGSAELGSEGLIPSHDPGPPVETKDQALSRPYHETVDYLNYIAARFPSRITRTEAIFGHDPAEEIVAYARREKVDLIAMTTHGRTGLAGC